MGNGIKFIVILFKFIFKEFLNFVEFVMFKIRLVVMLFMLLNGFFGFLLILFLFEVIVLFVLVCDWLFDGNIFLLDLDGGRVFEILLYMFIKV